MSLWRRTRNEVAGAWRSLRYDLGRRADERAESHPTGPEVTSTGMSTFGGPVADHLPTGYDDGFPRRPRRIFAVSAFGALAVLGAAGSYFAVVNGLGSLLSEKPAAAEAHPYPLTVAGTPPAGDQSAAGLGRGTVPGKRAPVLAAPAPVTTAPAAAGNLGAVPTPAPPRPRHTAPSRPTGSADPECDCRTPPVPTPTAAPSTSASAPATASPSPSASESASSAPSPSDSSSRDAAYRRKGHGHGY